MAFWSPLLLPRICSNRDKDFRAVWHCLHRATVITCLSGVPNQTAMYLLFVFSHPVNVKVKGSVDYDNRYCLFYKFLCIARKTISNDNLTVHTF